MTDYLRCGSLKEPLFATARTTADDGGSGTFYGLGYTVTVRIHLSAEYGRVLESVEMRMLGKVIAASTAAIE